MLRVSTNILHIRVIKPTLKKSLLCRRCWYRAIRVSGQGSRLKHACAHQCPLPSSVCSVLPRLQVVFCLNKGANRRSSSRQYNLTSKELKTGQMDIRERANRQTRTAASCHAGERAMVRPLHLGRSASVRLDAAPPPIATRRPSIESEISP